MEKFYDRKKELELLEKIENQSGADNIGEICEACGGVMIARGDMGVEIPYEELPGIQKRISATCLRARRPFMVVTQMLASMEHSPVPTRAEVTDIFQAVLDGASSLMLTGETAVGDYPVEAIKVLSETAEEALRFRMESRSIPL